MKTNCHDSSDLQQNEGVSLHERKIVYSVVFALPQNTSLYVQIIPIHIEILKYLPAFLLGGLDILSRETILSKLFLPLSEN